MNSIQIRTPKRSRSVVRKYECPNEHTFEKLVDDKDRLKPQKCTQCRKKAEPVFLLSRAALPAATIVYEKVVDGKVERLYVDPQVPESIGVAVKDGYQRREIQGMAQARQFEREVAAEMRAEHTRTQNLSSLHREEALREAHSELRNMMPSMDDFSRAIAEEAIRDSQSSGYSREYDPGFRIAAYSD